MKNVLSAYKTRRQFGKVIKQVATTGQPILVKQWKKPLVKIVPAGASVWYQPDQINEIRRKLRPYMKDLDSVTAVREMREKV